MSEWLDFWLETYKKPYVKAITYDMYYSCVNVHLKPTIGHYKLDKLTSIAVQEIFTEKSDKSYSLLRKIYITLSQSYAQAIRLKMVYINPCDNIVIPKKEARQMTAFSSDEQSRFLENCNTSSIYHDLFVFDFNTGMRLGEILALTWSDYNEDDKTIRINKNLSIVHDYSSTEKKTKTIIDTTKTKSSERIIPLNKKAIEVINRQREKAKTLFLFFHPQLIPH